MWQNSVCDVRCFVQVFVVFIFIELIVLLIHRLSQLCKYVSQSIEIVTINSPSQGARDTRSGVP